MITKPKPAEERDTLDLLELVCQLHSRALNQPRNKDMHDAYVEARQEMERRIKVNNNFVLADVRQRTFIVEEQISGTDYWESVSVRLPTLERAREFVKNYAPEHIKERFRIVDVYVA